MDESASFEMINKIIQQSICPVLKADGGNITLVDFSDGVVKIAPDSSPGCSLLSPIYLAASRVKSHIRWRMVW